MEPQVTDFPRDTSALAPNRQLLIRQSAPEEAEPGTEIQLGARVGASGFKFNQSKYIFTHIYVCVYMEKFQAVEASLAMTNQRVPTSAKKDARSHGTSVCITQKH